MRNTLQPSPRFEPRAKGFTLKKYSEPKLTAMGSFHDLTHGPDGSTNDGAGGGEGKAGSEDGPGKPT